jgi:hypothetical protein
MSEETNIPTTTQSADPVIASTPEPVNESWESQISRQLKSKPKIERTNLKSLEDLPDVATPVATDMDLVSTQETEDFLKQMDGGEVEAVKEKPDKEANEEVKDKSTNLFDISDIDLTKDPEPVAETKTKKSKEENIAELRKKAEAYEESLKTKDTELQSYREKLETLEGELERTAFEKSPKFRDRYQKPYSEAVQKAVAFATEMAGDESVAERALSLKGKERLEFIDESFGSSSAAALFMQIVNEADNKRGALEGALENYKATHQEIVQAEQQQQQQTIEEINRNFDRVAASLASKSDFFRITGDDEADKAVKARIAKAREIVEGKASQNVLMVTPFLASVAEDAINENAKLKAELAKYKNRAAEDAAVQPRISKGSIDAPENDIKGKPKSALASIRSQLKGI